MTAALVLDIVIAAVLVGRTILGVRNGLVVGSLSLVGVVAGGWAGLWAGPRVAAALPVLDASRLLRTIVLLLVFVLGVGLGETIGGTLGRRFRGDNRAKGLDAVLGGVAAALVVAVVTWGILMAARPVSPTPIQQAIDGSRIYKALDDVMPDRFDEVPGRAIDSLVSNLPEVFGGDEPVLPVSPPDDDALDSAEVQAAAASVVQVKTSAPKCESDSAGSGWVVAQQRVVTNAHVVAGSDSVTLSVAGSGRDLEASVVAFDPNLDLAILAVPDLTASPLTRAGESLDAGVDVVAAGYPWGGPYKTSSGRLRGTVTEDGGNIYGEQGIARQVYAIRGVVRPGNSGGPLLTGDGRVAGTVFAMSLVDSDTGYALTDAATGAMLDAASAYADPVSTGACASD
ncbi:acid resistance serine protease MarP [Brooklawnia cerclae]|uniref:S1-C subfamily serine protease n=1 Tax=Brooklawnia cerclae TaxID=349934 RepID=A0ABX0SJL9_9ACTN|nr:S1-C subfamily serine protease [Brooklawnia cerclae]